MLLSDAEADVEARAEGTGDAPPLAGTGNRGEAVRYAAVPGIAPGEARPGKAAVRLTVRASRGGIEALWLVPAGPLD
ncbi:MAG: hypothetical protein ACRELB_05455, partial [Polyangiaceae bacterium]